MKPKMYVNGDKSPTAITLTGISICVEGSNSPDLRTGDKRTAKQSKVLKGKQDRPI